MIEAVPNFSEGRDAATIAALARAVTETPGARLLHETSDFDHHRTVLTVAGERDAVFAAAVALAGTAVERIDLTRHAGVHPRLGAMDVLPFVPLAGTTMGECVALARATGEELWARFRLPVYLYEAAAQVPEHRALENLRRVDFRGKPDIGEGRHPTAGAAAVGARPFLVAWNIWLRTEDLEVAKRAAKRIRASSGGYAGVKAIGLQLASRGAVQISINSTDFQATPLHVVFEAVAAEAKSAGVPVMGSELIGLVPERALELSAGHDLHWLNITDDSVLENRLRA